MMLLTVNAGSSSIRLVAFAQEARGLRILASYHGEAEHARAEHLLREFITQNTLCEYVVIAHRVVHGGNTFVAPCVIDRRVETEIERLAPLAPLHNPPALAWLRACRSVLGANISQVAVFDTAFYSNLPAVARHYALPRGLCERHAIRRYGFHGIAHTAMWQRWRDLCPEVPQGGRVISIQLGAGCSITAVREGRAVDTSMGFSPLEGLVMATRSGNVDPGLLLYLQRIEGWSPTQLEKLLNEESGLLGLSGISGDMRTLLASSEPAARLAIEVYCHRVRKYVGAYLAALGGADAILIGGGVGEHAAAVREKILTGMEWCGMSLDLEQNRAAVEGEACISSIGSAIQVWIVPANEAEILAQEAIALTQGRATMVSKENQR